MRRIYPARTCKADAGFSLIEVIVAVAVVAMTVAAAASSILVSRKVETAALFYRDALFIMSDIQAQAYVIIPPGQATNALSRVTMEQEKITTDLKGEKPSWIIYTLRTPESDRRAVFALNTGTWP